MDLVLKLVKRMPSSPNLPSLTDSAQPKDRLPSRLAFFRRRVRLKGNSSISIPLSAVLLFPCIVIVLILVLVVRHPSSPAGILMPAGAPPSIRFVLSMGRFLGEQLGSLTSLAGIGRSARNTTRSLRRAVWNRRPMALGRTPPLSSWPETRSSRA